MWSIAKGKYVGNPHSGNAPSPHKKKIKINESAPDAHLNLFLIQFRRDISPKGWLALSTSSVKGGGPAKKNTWSYLAVF